MDFRPIKKDFGPIKSAQNRSSIRREWRTINFRWMLPISGFRLPRLFLRLKVEGLHVAPQVFAARNEGLMGGVFIVYLPVLARLELGKQGPLEAARATREIFAATEFDDLRDTGGQGVHLLRQYRFVFGSGAFTQFEPDEVSDHNLGGALGSFARRFQ